MKIKKLIKSCWVQSLSRVWLFATPLHHASLSFTNSWSLPKLMSIELVIPYNHLVLCRPLLLLPSVFPSIRFCSNESVLCIMWSKYWEFQLQHQSFQLFRTFVGKVMSLLFDMLLVISFLPGSKHLLRSCLQSPSAVILEPPQNKVSHCFHCFPIYLPWSDGTGCHDLHFLNVEF